MKKRFILGTAVVLILVIAGLWGVTGYYADLPHQISQQETIILGQNQFTPGRPSALRVVVRNSKDGQPVPGAQVRISLRAGQGGLTELFSGKADGQGNINAAFRAPDSIDPAATLLIETQSSLGKDTVERSVKIQRDYRVLLTTDKPLYQPGQVMHMRALALSAFDRLPAAAMPVEITVADGKGNKVFRQTVTTSEFGAASADFQLANEVNTGNYKITASANGESSEKTVEVEHYVLPKFAVKLSSDQAYYLPGRHAQGTVSAGYFYGKPVAGGQVTVEGYTFDVQRADVLKLQGATDPEGNFSFDFDLPDYLTGSELENGSARFYLQANVTDLAGHTETSNLSLPVAKQALVIQAIPEGGQFRPNVENILYVLTAYPDGSPAATSLQVILANGREESAETGPYGLAEIRLKPVTGDETFTISAQDAHGNQAQQEFRYEPGDTQSGILLRPDHPVYRVGETMSLTLLTAQTRQTVYLDIVRAGQTLSTRAVETQAGRADVSVDVTPDMAGTLELHAYVISPDEQIMRDSRLVVVDSAEDLSITLSPGKKTYQPGEQASLAIQVNGKDGAGVRSALGLAIVDESVFALASQDPGFARLYFLLEQQLLSPRYDIHGFSIPNMVGSERPVEDAQLQRSYEGAAFASLAAAVPQKGLFSLHASSHVEALQRAAQKQGVFFSSFSRLILIFVCVFAVGVFVLTILLLRRNRSLGKSFGIIVAGAAGLFVLGVIWWPLAAIAGALLIMLVMLGALGLLVQALNDRDGLLGLVISAMTGYASLVILFLIAIGKATTFSSTPEWLLLVSLLVVLGSLLLLIAGCLFWPNKPATTGGTAGAISALLLIIFLGGCAPAAAPTMAPSPTANPLFEARAPEEKSQAGSPAAPRLRQYFPETLLWMPDAVTDNTGSLKIDFPLADSITTWRMTALASTQDGRIGSATGSLRVFQDFFVDIDLPAALTVGDEIAVPVGIYNYLPEKQAVRLELDQPGWFELLDPPVRQIEIGANDIQVVYFKVRAAQFGPAQPFTITATGSSRSDAIQRTVRVFPYGKETGVTQSDRLAPGKTISVPVDIPANAIPGTQSLVVKVYPGILSQVVEGLDSILRMPSGCFEQTSSTTYPNVLVLDYLKSTGQAAPEAQMKAEQYINTGYQRLTTFETPQGGFSLFGDPPGDRMLTAYGLQEFSDMNRVHPVDEDLIRRTADWLFAQQGADGSWEPDRGMYHEASTWQNLRNSQLPTTAYITWSLVDAGFSGDPRVQKSLAYLVEHQAEAEDAYVLGLVANALAAQDARAGSQNAASTLERLAGMAQRDGDSAYWQSSVATFMGSQGTPASIETTALAALALQKGRLNPEVANAALVYLIRQKDSFGTWYSTQSTLWSLKALLESVRNGSEQSNGSVTVRLNGSQERTLEITPENAGVVHLIAFDDINPGENTLEMRMEGQGSLMYQVTGRYYLPWEALSQAEETGQEPMTLDLKYDRSSLRVDDTVQVTVTARLNDENAVAQSALIDLGLPPGFTPLTEDLDALVAAAQDRPADASGAAIERYELAGRQILIYVTNLRSGAPLTFSYRLKARFPLQVHAPASSAFDYYNPQVSGESLPELLIVEP